ncbi:transglycosylase domain-containing protein [Cellulomonas timonensis]|uniref:transglycosylase domain-containing protein n=1 Tax=Cellulomonas timonensis TaxID=1689271 RepID=UPI00082EC1E1|nr:transglycosylase domain-containing protein [Cellulomonas timonensis]
MAGSKRRSTTSARSRAAGARKASSRRRFFDYPRTGYRGLHRWLPSWRFLLGSVLGIGFLGLGALVAAYVVIEVPDPDAEIQSEASTIYFADNADGSQGAEMATIAAQKREIVPYDTLPDHVGDAVISSEDRTFWENRGVSIKGTVRALLNNVSGGKQQGASTLTQQYVERYYNLPTKSYVGKAKEALLAVKINQTVDKKDILGRYLNTIYFGRDSYGIQVAAKSYFGVEAKDLTIAQAALLAGIIPSPNNWDPAVAPEKAEQRWNSVLDNMVKDGHITQAERDAQVFPETIVYERSSVNGGTNGYLIKLVKDELAEEGITEEMIATKGYKIVTTIQEPLQNAAVASANSLFDGTLAGEVPNERTKAGLVSIDTSDGAIVALYGGADFIADQRNRVTWDKIQAGSTFKPFTLIAALQQGISLGTTYSGASPMKDLPGWGDKAVQNFGGQPYGDIDLVKATEQSVNTVYAQLNNDVTPAKTAEVAGELGITTEVGEVASNVLGSDLVHPLDMASAYATIAAEGFYSEPFIVRKVTYISDNSEALIPERVHEKRFEADVMADATYAMTQVVEKGSGAKYVKPLGRPIAGKTGTSTENKSAWFVGYTPQISTAVALSQEAEDGKGQDTISPFGRGVTEVTGSTWPAALWAEYMKTVFTVEPYAQVQQFPARANVGGKPTATPTETETEEPVVEEPVVENVSVPSVEGKLEADAAAALSNAELQVAVQSQASETVAKGRVISANPGAGTSLPKGSTVTIVVSSGAPPKPTQPPVTVPPVAPVPTPSPEPVETPAANPPAAGGAAGG